MTCSEQLSQFITTSRFTTLPADVIDRARLHLLDTLGVAIAGSRQANAINGRNGLQSMTGTKGNCHVWGSPLKLSPPWAALANGIASHVLDFDDTHTDSITHGSAILIPLVIALAEDLGLSGEEMLTAYIVGWEVAARVGLASGSGFHKRGFHSTPVAGIFGAVCSAAWLMKLSPQACAHAIGLAGSQASGVAEYLSNSSSAKCFHAGWAAHSAILSASLAAAGMTGPLTIFEGRFGLFVTHGLPDQAEPMQVCAELGRRWEMLRVSIKPFPCCHFAHATVDCARMLRQDGVRPQDIAHILCVVDPVASALICEPAESKFAPATPYGAKFSLPWLVASGMIDDGLNLDSFQPGRLARPEVLALAKKVSCRYCEAGEIPFPAYFPGLITATLQDGRKITKRLDINYGHPENPLQRCDVEQKFRDNVTGILTPRATEKIIELTANIESHPAAGLAHWLTETVN